MLASSQRTNEPPRKPTQTTKDVISEQDESISDIEDGMAADPCAVPSPEAQDAESDGPTSDSDEESQELVGHVEKLELDDDAEKLDTDDLGLDLPLRIALSLLLGGEISAGREESKLCSKPSKSS